jgi:hypothetical protein
MARLGLGRSLGPILVRRLFLIFLIKYDTLLFIIIRHGGSFRVQRGRTAGVSACGQRTQSSPQRSRLTLRRGRNVAGLAVEIAADAVCNDFETGRDNIESVFERAYLGYVRFARLTALRASDMFDPLLLLFHDASLACAGSGPQGPSWRFARVIKGGLAVGAVADTAAQIFDGMLWGLESVRLAPAILARSAIVPRSLDRGLFIQVIEMDRFSILA